MKANSTKQAMEAVLAYEGAFDAVLGDDYGNFMESRMVAQEVAGDGDPQAQAILAAMDAKLTAARAAGEAARLAVLEGGR